MNRQAHRPEELETPKTFTLIVPIQAGGDTVTEIILREPTAGELEQMGKDEVQSGSPVTAMLRLIARQMKLPPTDMRNLAARDLKRMEDYLTSFLLPSKESSES